MQAMVMPTSLIPRLSLGRAVVIGSLLSLCVACGGDGNGGTAHAGSSGDSGSAGDSANGNAGDSSGGDGSGGDKNGGASNGGNTGGGANSFGVSWDDDGAPDKFIGAKAVFGSSAGSDSYDVSAIGQRATVTVEVAAANPIEPQTFICGQTTAGQKVRVSYAPAQGGIELMDQSCTVVLTNAGGVGEAVSGTFEAVLQLHAGGTKTITNGKFNLRVSAF